MNDWKFCQSLKKRGLSQTALARLAGVGRCHLSQVLANVPGRGGHTRRKLFPHLTEDEILMLGWGAEYTDWKKRHTAEIGTKFRVEQPQKNAVESGVAA